jgi:hypothetical protein
MLARENEYPRIVPTLECGGDVVLLAFPTAHPIAGSIFVLTIRSPLPVAGRGIVSAPEPPAVSGTADAHGVIATSKYLSLPDLGTEDGMRHAFLVYGPELRSYAARRLGNHGQAEDAVQETLLRAWKHADGFDPSRGTVRGIPRSLVNSTRPEIEIVPSLAWQRAPSSTLTLLCGRPSGGTAP